MNNTRWLYCSILVAALVAVGCDRSESVPAAAPPAKPAQTVASNAAPVLPVGHPPLGTSGAALPPGHPPMDMSTQQLPAGTGSTAANPQWTVPADWQPGKVSSVRRGSYLVTGPGGQSAEVAVTVFGGDVGGMAMNVNRWRGQIGLGPIAPEQVAALTAKLEVNGIAATVVDLTGDQAPEGKTRPLRMLVVTVPYQGNSWFFKMTGDVPLVGAQKDAFLKFVQSAKF